MKCNQCDSVYINGTFCHETGCPDSWKDENGKGYHVPCFECGFDFTPEYKTNKYSLCSACQINQIDFIE